MSREAAKICYLDLKMRRSVACTHLGCSGRRAVVRCRGERSADALRVEDLWVAAAANMAGQTGAYDLKWVF